MYSMTAAHPTLPIPSYARVTRLASGASVVVRINDRGPFLSDRLIDLSYTAAYKLSMLAEGSAMVRVESILPAGMAAVSYHLPRVAALDAVRDESGAAPLDGAYVQLGAFGQRENAEAFLRRLVAEMAWLDGVAIAAQGGLYRVQAGPYADRASAQAVAARIEREARLRPMVVDR
jgi:rare lipoprotein A